MIGSLHTLYYIKLFQKEDIFLLYTEEMINPQTRIKFTEQLSRYLNL